MVRAFAGRATVDTYASFLDHRRRPVRAQIVRRVRRSARTVSADGGGSGWRRYGYSARTLVLVWAAGPTHRAPWARGCDSISGCAFAAGLVTLSCGDDPGDHCHNGSVGPDG